MGELIKAATLSKIPPGTCLHVEVAGREVAIFNVEGAIYAMGGTCTHKGGPLGEGELDGTVVTCPSHEPQRSASNASSGGSSTVVTALNPSRTPHVAGA